MAEYSAQLSQIQFLLERASIVTAETYLGSEEKLKKTGNDTLVFES